MRPFDPILLESLLWMHEGDALDFKAEQYRLSGTTDDEKSKVVKDVLAFANSWKAGDAHILVGFRENPGRRATPIGAERVNANETGVSRNL